MIGGLGEIGTSDVSGAEGRQRRKDSEISHPRHGLIREYEAHVRSDDGLLRAVPYRHVRPGKSFLQVFSEALRHPAARVLDRSTPLGSCSHLPLRAEGRRDYPHRKRVGGDVTGVRVVVHEPVGGMIRPHEISASKVEGGVVQIAAQRGEQRGMVPGRGGYLRDVRADDQGRSAGRVEVRVGPRRHGRGGGVGGGRYPHGRHGHPAEVVDDVGNHVTEFIVGSVASPPGRGGERDRAEGRMGVRPGERRLRRRRRRRLVVVRP
mmetsp:Transcript_9269/g.27944  ORF Transcript_9269/g.27944 Transcript_9269/m.27944 type:complete len:263 (+) Transcript_9269:646-1434(+)